MSNEFIQAHYEQLAAVAHRFGQQAAAQAAMRQRVLQGVETLRAGAWQGKGSAAFFTEMADEILPALQRLERAMCEAQKVTQQIAQTIQAAEQDAAAPFGGRDGLGEAVAWPTEVVGGGKPLLSVMTGVGQPGGPPPVPVPGDPTNEWKWNPNPQNRRGGSWGPKRPISGQGQPSGSWDPEGHWDIDDGKGNRQRHDENGNPISPEEAHDKPPKQAPSKIAIPDDLLTRMAVITGLTGTALIIYIVVSEGSRVLFPPRNLLPIP